MDFKIKTEEFVKSILLNEDLKRLPINLNKIAAHLGIKIEKYDFNNEVSGILIINDFGNAKIGYNPNEAEVRQRFSIAHELGHFILHSKNIKGVFMDKMMYRKNISLYSKNEEKIEVEANYFAANLLMPKALVLREVSMLDPNLYDEENMKKLAERFNVSETAMMYRLINLKLFRSQELV